MATLRDIRNRIKSVRNTSQITRAMKMVSAAKLRRAQEMAVAGRDYYRAVVSITRNLAHLAGPGGHRLFRPPAGDRADLIFFTSDKGLCGGFNSGLIRKVQGFVEDHPSASLIPVGKKGRDFFQRQGLQFPAEWVDFSRSVGLPLARQIAAAALTRIESGKTDATYIVYSRFVSVINQVPSVVQLFPIPAEAAPGEEGPEYLYEPSRTAMIERLVPLYTDVLVYQSLLETVASEYGARMSAMDTATKNAKEMISRLTLFYNRARQAAITKELIEVVSGADALEG